MTKITMLGGISYQEFLRNYWQKKPLLVRQAFPNFKNFVSKNDLFSLAYRDDMQSRLVKHEEHTWQLFEGPFQKQRLKKLTGTWTLLVQGVNYALPEVQSLLNKFNFIPYARLDDVMISFATPHGGVGPHIDSYDVFLLQGEGSRSWQISNQTDHTLLENTSLKILKKFKPSDEWVLEPGDMLYLPPQYAHNGVAINEGMTYSIGFRAPTHNEIITEFLGFLQENYRVPGIYQDPDLRYTKHPGNIPKKMIQHVYKLIHNIKFDYKVISEFLGQYLTQPKAHIFFDSPQTRKTKTQFYNEIKRYGIVLNSKTQMLYKNEIIFLNGEIYHSKEKILKELADNKYAIISHKLSKDAFNLLYQWYEEGYVEIKMTQKINEY